MTTDPLASMRCWEVDVEIGGETLTLPALPAAGWWPLLAGGGDDLQQFLDLLPAGGDLDDRLIVDPAIGEELASAFLEALEEVCGRPVAVAQVIAGVAIGSWGFIGGRLALAGFRWDVMPIAAALDAIHALAMEHFTDEARKKYEALLAQAEPVKLDKEQALSDFEATAGPRPQSSVVPSGDSPPRTRQPSAPPRRRAPSGAPSSPPAPPAESAPPARNDTPLA